MVFFERECERETEILKDLKVISLWFYRESGEQAWTCLLLSSVQQDPVFGSGLQPFIGTAPL